MLNDAALQDPPHVQATRWIAQEGSQRLFISCPVREPLYGGTRGPGKTDGLLFKFAKHTGRGYGAAWKGVIFRQTYRQLEDIVSKSKKWFYSFYPGVRYNAGDFQWTWRTGETLKLRYMEKVDDYNNYHGHEYPFIGWEELTNWVDLACYDKMKSCNRSSDKDLPRIYASTTNPYGAGHNVVKRRFIDPAPPGHVIVDRFSPHGRVYIHGAVTENKILMEADPEYVELLDAITDPNLKKAWRWGLWDITAGGMFDDLWFAPVHVLPPFHPPAHWRVERAFDYGSSRPFSVGWWTFATGEPIEALNGMRINVPAGSMIRFHEWYGWNGTPNVGLRMTMNAIAQGILEREERWGLRGRVMKGPADSSIFDVEDGKSLAAESEQSGIGWIPAHKAKGSRKQGWQRIRQMLANASEHAARRKGDDALYGEGIYVTDNCAQFKRTVPSLPRDQRDMDDVDTRTEDHIGDECRYAVYRKPQTAVQQDMY